MNSLRDRFTALFARLPYPNDEKVVTVCFHGDPQCQGARGLYLGNGEVYLYF